MIAVIVLGVAGCDVPLGAIRRGPPAGIDARVLSARASAPDFTLQGTMGPLHLADVLAGSNVLLVFYRGHW